MREICSAVLCFAFGIGVVFLLIQARIQPTFSNQAEVDQRHAERDAFDRNGKAVRICRSGKMIYEYQGKFYTDGFTELHGATPKDICD